MTTITRDASGPDGTVATTVRSSEWPDVKVMVVPDVATANPLARDLAREIRAMREEHAELESQVKDLRGRIKVLDPATDPRAFGPVHARQAENGEVWLMNDLAKGWGSFGYCFASWAEVAEHWPHLRTAGCGSDQWGPYVVMHDIRDWRK
jgi:hypothetical protein